MAAGVPEHPDEDSARRVLAEIPAKQIEFICCPHAGDNLPGKWQITYCELILLGDKHLVLCPVCWQVVRAAVYDSIVRVATGKNKP
jgi:hypothetical protein